MIYLLIAAAGAACIAALLLLRGRIGLRIGWAVAGAAAAFCACLLAAFGLRYGVLFTHFSARPEETVEDFFQALTDGEYDEAYACLENYSDLGLSGEPEDKTTALLYRSVRDSYAFELVGDAEIDGLEAVQRVKFRGVDLAAMEEDARAAVLKYLEQAVEERSYSEVYDENNEYRPEVIEEAYEAVIEALCEDNAAHERSETLTIRLLYGEKGWRIVADSALLNALSGFSA